MKLYHNSQLQEYRAPFGAVPEGTEVTISLLAEGAPADLCCFLSLWTEELGQHRVAMERQDASSASCRFTCSQVVSKQTAVCWYYFYLTGQDGREWYYGNNSHRLGGEGCLYEEEPPAYQITVYRPQTIADWYTSSIVYQIFPDRFCRSEDWLQRQAAADRGPDWKGPARVIQQNWYDTPYYTKNAGGQVTRWPFFGGTLSGIRDRLLYIKSMGAGAIYLNPIFMAASNHKYDTADYMQIDPAFGTEEDFRLLASDARRLGIRLILDGVFNHTGADSRYFNQHGNFDQPGACQGPDSPYYSWYRFADFPDQYDCWWGVGDLPNVEELDAGYQAFIYEDEDSVIRHWLRAGAAGWRLDVADELPGSFITGIRSAIKQTDPEGLLLGEVWEDASNKVSYGAARRYLLGDELDAVMNYPLRDLLTDFMLGKIPAQQAVRRLRSLSENYPPQHLYSALNLIGSHDRIRILTLMGDAPSDLTEKERESYRLPEDKLALARQRLKVLSLMQFVLPGVPSVYYGDEAGAEGYEDPYNRGTYPWGREDAELLAHYRMLAGLRKQYPFLTSGSYRFSWMEEHVLICERTAKSGGESIVAVINRHIFGSLSFDLELPGDTGYVLELLESKELMAADGSLHLDLPALSAVLLYCSRKAPRQLRLNRSAGVLCHISSLPSGRLDEEAERFLDFLAASGQKLWQILPLNPTDERGGSPYSSPAVFAGNTACSGPEREMDRARYKEFCSEEEYWLEDYALYTMLKKEFRGLPWQKWTLPERERKNLETWKEVRCDAIEEIKKQQFLFWERWDQIKRYANAKGISIIGDLPLYAGVDSVDTWAHPEVFLLRSDGLPLAGAGVPPDYFNEEGQNWGNPLYDWDALKKDRYGWWQQRIARAIKHFDYIRLDHFRSFSAFYAIPHGKTAKEGWWLPGVGKDFFEVLTEKLGPLPFLAEDLGLLDHQVDNLLKLSGYPGMLVYQFSGEEMRSLPPAAAASKIFYTGTHDNQSLAGWCKENTTQEADTDDIIKSLYQSAAPWVITPLQDLLGLGDESRMNVPGQAEGNWTWRAAPEQLTPQLAARMRQLALDTSR